MKAEYSEERTLGPSGYFFSSRTHILTTISASCVFSDYKEVTDKKLWFTRVLLHIKGHFWRQDSWVPRRRGNHKDKGPIQF